MKFRGCMIWDLLMKDLCKTIIHFFGKSCFGDSKINGTFNSIPRGVIKYTGSQIESGSITNRFIQGTYLKKHRR